MAEMQAQLRKYFIMGSQNCDQNPADILEAAIQGGITAFQFREKGRGALTGSAKLALGKELRAICLEHRIPFFINDDIELVEPLAVDGIHVGQADRPVTDIKQAYPHLLIGLSISNQEELAQSPLHLIDYVGAGPVFLTQTKEDSKQVVGTGWIESLREAYPTLPIVGIGGIRVANAAQVLQAGADGVAVISAITKAVDIVETVRKL